MKFLKALIFVVILVIAIYGLYIRFPRIVKVDHEKPTIAATLFPLYDIVKNVAGDQINVVLILPPGASPHTFEPTPTILREVEKAEIIFAIGHGLDDWTKNLVENQQKIMIVDREITLRDSDPHYFLTGENAIKIAQTITESLLKIFPELNDEINTNIKIYQTKLRQMDEQIKDILQNITLKTKKLITFHDAWYYFAEAYGLEIVGTFEPTVGREPTPRYLAELSQKIKEIDAKVLYAEPQFSTRGLESFLKDNNVLIAIIDPEGGADESTSYINMLISNAKTIAENQ